MSLDSEDKVYNINKDDSAEDTQGIYEDNEKQLCTKGCIIKIAVIGGKGFTG